MANLRRIARHLLMTHWRVRRTFPRETLLAIEQAIVTSESTHIGQLRFAVEGTLSLAALSKGLTAREACHRGLFAAACLGYRTQQWRSDLPPAGRPQR